MRISTASLNPKALGQMETLWVYNGLDAMLTREVFDVIKPQLDNATAQTYAFSLSLQAPVLAMMRRGLRVDHDRRLGLISHLEAQAEFLQLRLDAMASAVWGKGLNPNSPKAVGAFFYDQLGLPEQRKRAQSGERRRTVDRDALERVGNYFQAMLFVSHILRIRELRKLAATLRSESSPDGRMRCSFNIAGTETGRFSSSSDAFDTGTNLQNQTERLRRIYISDPGHKFASFDLKTGESFAVGVICKLAGLGDAYLRACEGGDLHTTAARNIWPSLGWTSDARRDRELAEGPFYRHFSYRDFAKRAGHGTNYFGQPWNIAKILKVPKGLIEEFQKGYFEAFPEIREWHRGVAEELQTRGVLTTLMGRRRHFLGRKRDDATLREAIAFEPQSCIADYTNQWLLRVHNQVPEAELLLQVHDSILVQFEDNKATEKEVLRKVQDCARQVRLGNDTFSIQIPVDASVGWNWGKVDPKCKFHEDGNPFGLAEVDPRGDPREFKEVALLDRRLS